MNLQLATTLLFISSASASNLRVDKPRRYLSSDSDSDELDHIKVFCLIPAGCENKIDLKELKRIAEDALDEYNESSSSSSEDIRRRNLKERTAHLAEVLDDSCNRKRIADDLEEEFESASAESGSRSRIRRHLGSHDSSSSSSEATLDMVCVNECDLQLTSRCGSDLNVRSIIDDVADNIDLRRRRLGDADVKILDASELNFECNEDSVASALEGLFEDD